MPASWAELTEGHTYGAVMEAGSRGDFLSVVGRSGPEGALVSLLQQRWAELGAGSDQYKVRAWRVGLGTSLPNTSRLADHVDFLRSDHARFWYSNQAGLR